MPDRILINSVFHNRAPIPCFHYVFLFSLFVLLFYTCNLSVSLLSCLAFQPRDSISKIGALLVLRLLPIHPQRETRPAERARANAGGEI